VILLENESMRASPELCIVHDVDELDFIKVDFVRFTKDRRGE
jgi:hypothetical protein